MKVLVYLETQENSLLQGSLELLTLAARLGGKDAAAVLVGAGQACEKAAHEAARYGVPVTLLELGAESPDALVAALEGHIRDSAPDAVLLSSTQRGRECAARLAQRFDAGCATGVTAIDAEPDGLVVTRPAYGGTVLERLRLAGDRVQLIAVRSGSFAKPDAGGEGPITVVLCTVQPGSVRAKVVAAVREITDTVDLEGAKVIVAGGRGMGDAEHFKLVEQLAAALGGVVGATRPAIEEGWISRAHQVGQSGKTVAPALYIACGISGAMQHISGMMGAKYIVAVNKDEDAPIFGIADIGIVGDAKEILPLLIEQLGAGVNA